MQETRGGEYSANTGLFKSGVRVTDIEAIHEGNATSAQYLIFSESAQS